MAQGGQSQADNTFCLPFGKLKSQSFPWWGLLLHFQVVVVLHISLLQNESNPARTTGSAENTGRKVREWFDLKPGKEIFQDVSGRNDKEKKISRTWNCFLQGSLHVLSVFFSQWLDKWTSTPQSAWRFNRSKYSGSSISFPDAAEQAQKKARMEESWGHESLISFSPHFNYFLPLNSKIATTE